MKDRCYYSGVKELVDDMLYCSLYARQEITLNNPVGLGLRLFAWVPPITGYPGRKKLSIQLDVLFVIWDVQLSIIIPFGEVIRRHHGDSHDDYMGSY
jgi:hypothetical protein